MATALSTYYANHTIVDNIPTEQRLYDKQLALLTRIGEGRAPMMRLLLGAARSQGGFIAQDTKSYWGIETRRKPQIGVAIVTDTTNIEVTDSDAAQMYPGDLFFADNMFVEFDGTDIVGTKVAGALLNEVIEIVSIGASAAGTTAIVIARDHGGSATPIVLTTATKLTKMINSMPEGDDDLQIFSDTDDEDYNYAQIVGRKWGATQTEENITRAYTRENTFQRNGRRMLESFWDELEFLALMGRRAAPVVDGTTKRKKWFAGGLMEYIPESNWFPYSLGTDNLFTPELFNGATKNMFYWGSQVKIGIAGADFYTKLSDMFGTSNMYALPAEKNSWGVALQKFTSSNGGTIYFAPSDLLSLYGLSDVCMVYDPSHFQFGNLQNMQIQTYSHNLENPHERTAEIYGQITFKRTNPKAHWAFRSIA